MASTLVNVMEFIVFFFKARNSLTMGCILAENFTTLDYFYSLRFTPRQSIAIRRFILVESSLSAKNFSVICRAARHLRVSDTHADR